MCCLLWAAAVPLRFALLSKWLQTALLPPSGNSCHYLRPKTHNILTHLLKIVFQERADSRSGITAYDAPSFAPLRFASPERVNVSATGSVLRMQDGENCSGEEWGQPCCTAGLSFKRLSVKKSMLNVDGWDMWPLTPPLPHTNTHNMHKLRRACMPSGWTWKWFDQDPLAVV